MTREGPPGRAGGPDPGPLLALNFGFARARVLDTADELGVFAALDGGPRTAAALAAELECDPVGTARLLDALAELGLLSAEEPAGYALTDAAAAFLLPASPSYLGGHFAEVLDQWDNWAALTSLVRTGHRGPRAATPAERGEHPGMFAGAFPLAAPIAAAVVAALGLRPAGDVLDYTAGSGEWGIALAAAGPEARITAHDRPELLETARRRVAQTPDAGRFTWAPGDFGPRPPFPDAGFDLVVAAHAGRFAGAAETRRLIGVCARLLRPGGTLLLADVMRAEPGAPALSRSMLDLSLLVNTRHGGLRDPADHRTDMEHCGLVPKETVTRGLVTALTGERQ
ncbi:methyltransferase dimerization domain-containing protein [Streptomyces sp. NPDC060194]|uniref:methyltransferase family protein n=1 Tax=Streptomyces sp. NPDC060194 TaxID=3347069 RepID=UPI0036611650